MFDLILPFLFNSDLITYLDLFDPFRLTVILHNTSHTFLEITIQNTPKCTQITTEIFFSMILNF